MWLKVAIAVTKHCNLEKILISDLAQIAKQITSVSNNCKSKFEKLLKK